MFKRKHADTKPDAYEKYSAREWLFCKLAYGALFITFFGGGYALIRDNHITKDKPPVVLEYENVKNELDFTRKTIHGINTTLSSNNLKEYITPGMLEHIVTLENDSTKLYDNAAHQVYRSKTDSSSDAVFGLFLVPLILAGALGFVTACYSDKLRKYI